MDDEVNVLHETVADEDICDMSAWRRNGVVTFYFWPTDRHSLRRGTCVEASQLRIMIAFARQRGFDRLAGFLERREDGVYDTKASRAHEYCCLRWMVGPGWAMEMRFLALGLWLEVTEI